MKCKACVERGKPWDGVDPTCSFEKLFFDPRGWQCATVEKIRELVHEGQGTLPWRVDYRYCEDMKYATVNIHDLEISGAMALWVSWYKNRGSTDAMWLLFSDKPPRRPTEDECLRIVADAGSNA